MRASSVGCEARCSRCSRVQDRVAREVYEFGPFRVDPEKETLFRASQSVPLTPKTFQILLVLIRNNNEVVTEGGIMKTVWPDTFVEEANLRRNVLMLRKALGESAQDHRYIVTVPGRGYRLAESVQRVPDQELTVIAGRRYSSNNRLSSASSRTSVSTTRFISWVKPAHQCQEAAMEFRRVLDHRGIVGSDPIGASAQLELGRAFAFPDPDIPILSQTGSEYGKPQ